MVRVLRILISTCIAVALLVVSLNVWAQSLRWTSEYARPDVAAIGMRCLSVAAFAGGQLVILALVVDAVYRPKLWGWLVRAGVGLVCSVALVCGIALGWVGR